MTRILSLRAALIAGAVLLAACSAAADAGGNIARSAEPASAEIATPPDQATPSALAGDGPLNAGDAVPAPTVDADGLAAVKAFRSARGHDEPAPPASVVIPAIGVDSPLVTLGRASDGTVEVPGDFQRAGWFDEGAIPGQRGPAVILGHVDSRAGPAVFYRLHELEPGDEVFVDDADGSSARFVVNGVERYDKNAFPTQAVYYPTLDATLRLVTCGGSFDPEARSYRDNIVVFATLAG